MFMTFNIALLHVTQSEEKYCTILSLNLYTHETSYTK